MHGDPLTLSGGKAIRYGALLILDLRKRSIQESDPIKREEGLKIGVTVRKNHVLIDRFPYLKAEYYVIFGQGTEIYLEALDLAIQQGILLKAGAFIKLPDADGNPQIINGEKMQWQGNARFRHYCMDNPEFFANLKARLEGKADTMNEEEIANAKVLEEEDIKGLDEKDKEEIDDVLEKAAKAKAKKKEKAS